MQRTRGRRHEGRSGYRDDHPSKGGIEHREQHPLGANPGDVWTLPTRRSTAAHFAMYPVDLPLRCITAGSPEGGTVLDPFSGAGTTGAAARSLGRNYIGIDINADYHDLAIPRLTGRL